MVLDSFSEQEAIRFVKQNLPSESQFQILCLVNTLHRFPLALAQAVSYIRKHTSISDFLKLYSGKFRECLDLKNKEIVHHEETLWNILYFVLDNLSDPSREVLYRAAYLDSYNIGLELFDDIPLENMSEVIKELRASSLITLDKYRKSFRVHKLIQEFVLLINKDNLYLKKVLN